MLAIGDAAIAKNVARGILDEEKELSYLESEYSVLRNEWLRLRRKAKMMKLRAEVCIGRVGTLKALADARRLRDERDAALAKLRDTVKS